MTIICDNCEEKVIVAGFFTFNSNNNVEIWKGHLCCPCQISLVSGKALQQTSTTDKEEGEA